MVVFLAHRKSCPACFLPLFLLLFLFLVALAVARCRCRCFPAKSVVRSFPLLLSLLLSRFDSIIHHHHLLLQSISPSPHPSAASLLAPAEEEILNRVFPSRLPSTPSQPNRSSNTNATRPFSLPIPLHCDFLFVPTPLVFRYQGYLPELPWAHPNFSQIYCPNHSLRNLLRPIAFYQYCNGGSRSFAKPQKKDFKGAGTPAALLIAPACWTV